MVEDRILYTQHTVFSGRRYCIREWSITSDKYTEEDFRNLIKYYNSEAVGVNGAISLGTIYFHAREEVGMVKNPLTELQEKFSIIDLTGQWYVLDNDQIAEAMEGVGSVKYYKRQEAKLLIERYIEAKPIVVTDDQISDLIADFCESKHTVLQFRRIRPYSSAFYSLKLLAGHGVVPKKGQFETLLHLLYRVICNGNRDHFDYLFRFIAHMLQKPEEKPDVAIIMIGGQGTG